MPSTPGSIKRSVINDKERSQLTKFTSEFNRLRNKAFNINFVLDESALNRDRLRIDRKQMIGQGAWWQMYKASYLDDSRDYAMKIIKMDDLPKVYHHCVDKEHLKLYASFSHPVLAVPTAIYKTDTKFIYILLELSGHKHFMSKYLESHEIPIPEIKKIGRSFGLALQYLHEMGVAHTNCTCNNIMMDDQYHVKLFGLEYFHQCYDLAGNKHLSCLPYGKSPYLPPEVLETPLKPYDPCCVDIWFYGCSLAYMATRKYPFGDAPTKRDIGEKIAASSWIAPEDDLLKQLLTKIFVMDPSTRTTVGDILSHQFFSGMRPSTP